MPDVTIAADVEAGKPTEASNQNTQNDATAETAAAVTLIESDLGPLNGSFEYDLDSDTDPDAWDPENFSGGSYQLSSSSVHGAQAFQFTTTVGGGWARATSEQFINCSPGDFTLDFWMAISAAVPAKVFVIFYKEDKTTVVDTVTAFDFTGPQQYRGVKVTGEVPGGARFAVVRVQGGESGGSTAADVLFDGVAIDFEYDNPELSGTTYNVTSVGYTTLETFDVFVPSTAATLAVTVTFDKDGLETLEYRARIASNNGTVASSSIIETAPKTSSITLTGTEQGKMVTVTLEAKVSSGSEDIITTSDTTNGFESKISIT